MNKSLLATALVGVCVSALADDSQVQATSEKAFDPRPAMSAPVEKIVREGRICYLETTAVKMVEACYEGKTYSTPIAEKSRVKIKCPAK